MRVRSVVFLALSTLALIPTSPALAQEGSGVSEGDAATRIASAGLASLPAGLLAIAAVGLMLRRVRGLRRTD
jgi:hypothetical protein